MADMTGLVPSQVADIRNPHQPESFKMLSSEEQSALVRCHKNLGHPSPERLSTVLRQQGYRPGIAKAAWNINARCASQVLHPSLLGRVHFAMTLISTTEFALMACLGQTAKERIPHVSHGRLVL